MAKRKKEKDITHSEAIELAVEEFSPFWFNSEPIFVGVNEHEGDPEPPKYSVFPLNSKFEEMDWMFFFLDPTLFSCETAIVYAKEWHRRFQHFNIQPLLILGPIYKDYLSKKTVKALIDRHRITFPLLADRDFMVHKAFGAFGDIPKLMLHHEKKIVFESSGENWLDVELKFHEYLRSTDPGLPLERPFVPEEKQLHDQVRLNFGKKGLNVKFINRPKGEISEKERPDTENSAFVSGKWDQTSEALQTSDPTASITFFTKKKNVSVVAKAIPKLVDYGKVAFEVNGTALHDIFAASDLKFDDTGSASVEVKEVGLYHAIINLKDEVKEISLKFPVAQQATIVLYGVRLSD